MDALDRELYHLTPRLPRVRTDNGPTAEWMAYLEELQNRVADFPLPPTDGARETSVKLRRSRKKRRLAS